MTIPDVTFLQSPYQNARDARYGLRAFVNHRIVGTLPSARQAFGLVAGNPGRSASSHFGIGYVGGRLTIDQYVPLDRMAWTNGDVREPSWSRIIPGVNPNLYTVTIEHEDGGYAGLGVISEEVWRASMELQAVLASGDAAAIRALGIRGATDAMVAQMRAIPKDATGFIDHHQIAGPNKPYCLRRWLDDPGLVEGAPSRRDRLLAAVKAGYPQEDDEMGPTRRKADVWRAKADLPVYQSPSSTSPVIATIAGGAYFPTIQEQARRNADGTWTTVGPWRTVVLFDDRTGYVNRAGMDPVPAPGFDRLNRGTLYEVDTEKVPPWPFVSGGISEADAAARAKAAAKAAAGAVKTAAAGAAAKYGA